MGTSAIRHLTIISLLLGLLAGVGAAVHVTSLEKHVSYYLLGDTIIQASSGETNPNTPQLVAALSDLAARHPGTTIVRIGAAVDADSGKQQLTYIGDPSTLPIRGFTPGLEYLHEPASQTRNLYGYLTVKGADAAAVAAEAENILHAGGLEVSSRPKQWWMEVLGSAFFPFALLIAIASLLAGVAISRSGARAQAITSSFGHTRSRVFVSPWPVVAALGGAGLCLPLLGAFGATITAAYLRTQVLLLGLFVGLLLVGLAYVTLRITPERVRAVMGGDIPDTATRRLALVIRIILAPLLGIALTGVGSAYQALVVAPENLPDTYTVDLVGAPSGYENTLAPAIRTQCDKGVCLLDSLDGGYSWQYTPGGPALISITADDEHQPDTIYLPEAYADKGPDVARDYPGFRIETYTGTRLHHPMSAPQSPGDAVALENPIIITYPRDLRTLSDRNLSAALSRGALHFTDKDAAKALAAGEFSGGVRANARAWETYSYGTRRHLVEELLRATAVALIFLAAARLARLAQGARAQQRAALRTAFGWNPWRIHARPLTEETSLALIAMAATLVATARLHDDLPAWAHMGHVAPGPWPLVACAALCLLAALIRTRQGEFTPWTSR